MVNSQQVPFFVVLLLLMIGMQNPSHSVVTLILQADLQEIWGTTWRFDEPLPLLRDTLASVLSGTTARIRSLPDLDAARWRPKLSTDPPHSHLQFVMSRGRQSLSKITVRNTSIWLHLELSLGWCAPRPEWERRWAWSAAADWANTTVSRQWCSRGRRLLLAKFCLFGSGRAPNLNSSPRWSSDETICKHCVRRITLNSIFSGSLCSLSLGSISRKNNVCILLEFWPPGITPELMIEWRLNAHPMS